MEERKTQRSSPGGLALFSGSASKPDRSSGKNFGTQPLHPQDVMIEGPGFWSEAHDHSSAGFRNNSEAEKMMKTSNTESGAMGYIFLWLLGIPIPVLLLIFLLRGCT